MQATLADRIHIFLDRHSYRLGEESVFDSIDLKASDFEKETCSPHPMAEAVRVIKQQNLSNVKQPTGVTSCQKGQSINLK